MKYNNTLALIPALLLAACGDDTQTINEPLSDASVVYSYPADGQRDVIPETAAIMRFSHPITDSSDDLKNKIEVTANGNTVPFDVTAIDGGKSLKLSFDSALGSATDYSISFREALIAEDGRAVEVPNAHGDPGIQFRTRGSLSGVASITNQSDSFGIDSQVPGPDGDFKAMNFSTFRLTMTQPIHPDWEDLGGSVELLDSNDQPVPATLLVKSNRIALDPCVTQDPLMCGGKEDVLNSGEEYTLKIQNLASLTDPSQENRFSTEWTFTPRDTGPTVMLQQSAVDSGLGTGASENEITRSILNGKIINGVTLNSVLQGSAGPSQQTGDLFAELAFAPAFETNEALPLRIAKGSVLSSTSLDILVGGIVPVLDAKTGTLQTTGDIKVTMMSDASGYMSPNAYTDDMNAPRHITLFMDVAMNTENAQPNAALSQTLMGVELRGIAIVEDGVLTIDAIGTVEPGLLGQEYTDSTIAFHLQAATDVDSALDAENLRPMDSTAPSLVSWTPGPENAIPDTRQAIQRPGDPVILFFDEPLDPDSLDGGITLTANGSPVENTDIRLDGTTVTVNPEGGLKHGVDYQLNVNGVTDLAGNVAALEPLNFSLDPTGNGSEQQRSPIALTTYPGYPCVTTGVDLANNTHGQCVDDAPDGPRGDTLPITTMPGDRPIVVVFSQSMNLDSIRLGETFSVEKVDANGSLIETVSGRLEKGPQRIRFYPDEPWETDSYYRYTLASQDQGACADGASPSFICGVNGMALETDLLVDPDRSGGPDMAIYFRGTKATDTVFTPLRNLPIRDTNSNYVVDCDALGSENCLEPFDHEPDGNGGYKPSANSARLGVVDQKARALGVQVGASVGCEANESCPRNKFIYQTYGLNTEVIGPARDESGNEIGVRVLLYPTMLATTSASVFLDGFGEQATGPQILRMRYGTPTEDNPLGLVEGRIVENEDGVPVFQTTADLMLDAPNLQLPLADALEHNLYSKAFTLELEGPIDFFDDGRMQITQINSNAPPINVNVNVTVPVIGEFLSYTKCVEERGFEGIFTCLADSSTETERGDISIPLEIPPQGVYLNFVSNPVKEIPAQE